MIVTVVNCAPPGLGSVVAETLALLRSRAGCKVLLLDAGSGQDCEQWHAARVRARLGPAPAVRTLRGFGCAAQLERLQAGFRDIVIATDGCGGHDCRWALIAAQVAVVPLGSDHGDIDTRCECIARLNSARMFNPGLRVLFVTMTAEHAPARSAMYAVRTYAAQVMSAGLASTVLHLPALAWGADGRCACDTESSTDAAEMVALYGEVYPTGPASPLPRQIFRRARAHDASRKY